MENVENTEVAVAEVFELITETATTSPEVDKVVTKTKSSTTTKLSTPTPTRLVKEGDVITLTEDISYRGKVYYKSTQGTVRSVYEPNTHAHNKFALPFNIKDKALYITVDDNPFNGFVISSSAENFSI